MHKHDAELVKYHRDSLYKANVWNVCEIDTVCVKYVWNMRFMCVGITINVILFTTVIQYA